MFNPHVNSGPRSSIARSWQRVALLGMVLAIAFSTLGSLPAGAQAALYEATANLNIRSEPNATAPVVGGIPSGGSAEVTGAIQNNFYPVSYNGIDGFASADFLRVAGSGGDEGGGDEGGTDTGPTGTRYTEARLNLRSGPGASFGVIAIMPDGAQVELTGESSNGFSRLTWNGNNGWASTQFLTTEGGPTEPTPAPVEPTGTPTSPAPESPSIGETPVGTATVSTGGLSLNMRGGPGTSFGVVRSIPNGAQVEVMGSAQNGFLPVRYGGTTGWASSQYLRTGSTGTPVTPTATATATPTATATATAPPTSPSSDGAIGDTVTGSATVTTVGLSLNIRSGPGTSFGVIRSIPSGSQVDLMGASQNEFWPVRYQGTTGWASAEFLRTGSASTPVPTATATATPANPTPTATATPDGNATGSGMVTAGRLNFRNGPGTSSPVIGVLTYGTRVDITGGAQNGFLPIRAQGTIGWVAQEYIDAGSTTNPTPTPTPTTTATPVTPTATPATTTPSPTTPPGAVSGTAVVSVTGTLNMRSGPGTNFPVIRGLANGSQVDLLGGAQNGFRPIRYQGTDGWASEAYLDIGATNPDDPQVPAIGNAAVGKATMNATVS
ncbi:MAG: SH3 domain-containing protein, partial [Chloroflexia bacterium]|nr:SH3 domain-containing protein [Chloroflexia bacterium]